MSSNRVISQTPAFCLKSETICGQSSKMRLNVLTKLSRLSFGAFSRERSQDFQDSRAKTGITPFRKNTRKSDLARSKGTSSQFPAPGVVAFGSPARLKDNANSFGSHAALTAGMR